MAETEQQLEALDHLGPGFHIMDYYQLKTDNRNLNDKLEDRDNELIKIRKSAQNIMQLLAHNREKSNAIDTDIKKFSGELENVNIEYEDVCFLRIDSYY